MGDWEGFLEEMNQAGPKKKRKRLLEYLLMQLIFINLTDYYLAPLDVNILNLSVDHRVSDQDGPNVAFGLIQL